eukprot:7914302-Pyramimonas_sp.AAC.1
MMCNRCCAIYDAHYTCPLYVLHCTWDTQTDANYVDTSTWWGNGGAICVTQPVALSMLGAICCAISIP